MFIEDFLCAPKSSEQNSYSIVYVLNENYNKGNSLKQLLL